MKKKRLSRGKVKEGATFPVAPGRADLPAVYSDLAEECPARTIGQQAADQLPLPSTLRRLKRRCKVKSGRFPMNPEWLLKNFDCLIDTPDHCGKLVEQNLEDKPGAELEKEK